MGLVSLSVYTYMSELPTHDLRGVVGVELDLVDGRCGLEARIGKQLLEVLDGEVGNTNVLDATGLGKLLKLSPGVKEVPVGVVLAQVIRVGGRGPVLDVVSMYISFYILTLGLP